MAIEDAAALEVLLSDLAPGDTVEDRLKLWNQLRLPRCSATQFLSNRWYKDVEERDAGMKKWYQGPLPGKDASTWSDPWNDMFHAYNIFDEAEKVKVYKNTSDGVPEGAFNVFAHYDPSKYTSGKNLNNDLRVFDGRVERVG